MLAEAADRAGADSLAAMTRIAATMPAIEALPAMLRAYLSTAHVEAVETDCPVAALGSEMPRQAPEVRRAATRRIKETIDLVAAVDDPRLSDALRAAALKHFSSESGDNRPDRNLR